MTMHKIGRSLVVLFLLSLSIAAFAIPPVGESEWGLKIVIFDVGQADAALFLTPDGEAALVDIGKTRTHGQDISEYLLCPEDNGIAAMDTLKLLFCSHYDGDHIGGASGLDGKINILAAYDQGPSLKRNPNSTSTLYGKYVRLVGDPNGNGERDAGESTFVRHKAKPSSKFALGKSKAVKIRVLSICGDTRGKKHDLPLSPANAAIDENPGSLIQLITLGDFDYLTMGDATSSHWKNESDTEAKMLAAGAIPKGVDIDVLKVGHHGSDTSSGLDFVKAVHPEVAVISSGPTKDHLPKLTSIKALEKCGAKVLVTGSAKNEQGVFNDSELTNCDDGYEPEHTDESTGTITILVSSDGSRYTVRLENQPEYSVTKSTQE